MGDFNNVTLAGRLVKPTLKNRGGKDYFDAKVQCDPSGEAFPVGVSAFANTKELKEKAEKIIQDFEAGMTQVVIYGGQESGYIKDDEYRFYSVNIRLNDVTLLASAPTAPRNSAEFRGKIHEIESDDTVDWLVLGASYFSRNPKDPEDEGSWKDKFIRISVPKDLWPNGESPEQGSRAIVFGQVVEKLGDDFFHHVRATNVAVL